MSTEILFFHGWGFDSTAWNGWPAAFSASSGAGTSGPLLPKCLVAERGYFGIEPSSPVFTDSSERIVIAHSLGLHFIDPATLHAADVVLIFNGFLQFGSERVIRSMRHKLKRDPQNVLRDFWQNCYSGETQFRSILPVQSFDVDRLDEDLAVLAESKLDASALESVEKIISVYAAEDKIVSTDSKLSLIQSLPNASHVNVAGASHALPFTHIQTCIELLNQARSRKLRQPCHQ